MTVTIVGAWSFDNIGGTIIPDLSGHGWNLDLTGSAGAAVASGHTGGAFGKTGGAMAVFPAGLVAATETDDRAVMFWANGNLTTWWVRWEKDSIGSGTWGILNLGDGFMKAQVRDAADSLATRPAAALPGAAWHHYCLRYQKSTGLIDLLLDGVLMTPGPPNGRSSFTAGTALSTGANRINMGEWSSAGAAVDDLRMLSSWPTDAEVVTLAAAPVAALTAQANFFHA